MAEIKSALEIALARTEGMEVDKEKVKAKENRIKGRKAALAFLEGKSDAKELSSELKKEKGDARDAFKAGAAGSMMAYLKLPSDESYTAGFQRAAEGLEILAGGGGQIKQMFDQLGQFFDQYLQNRTQLEQQLQAQFEPLLKQKEEALHAQTGSRISIDPLDDPDFQKAYSQNMENLSRNYLEALNQAKEQLKAFLELEE